MTEPFSIELPITFNEEEALDYYHTLVRDYQHLKWKMTETEPGSGFVPESAFLREETDMIPNVIGWAILTPKDVNEPHCMLYDTEIQGREYYKETPCAFGFAKKLLDKFPTVFRMYLTVNSPGVVVLPHVDNENMPRRIYKIIIPVQTNPYATWTVDEGVIHFKTGCVYLVDTLKTHATQNLGNTDRVYFMFEFLEEDLESIKNLNGII